MTHIERIARRFLDDPWAARVFLAFTVGMFLSCSAEFAAEQGTAPLAISMSSVGGTVGHAAIAAAAESMN